MPDRAHPAAPDEAIEAESTGDDEILGKLHDGRPPVFSEYTRRRDEEIRWVRA
jgi:hypothetical protein